MKRFFFFLLLITFIQGGLLASSSDQANQIRNSLSGLTGEKRVVELNKLSSILIESREFEEANTHIQEALKWSVDNGFESGLSNAYDNAGLIYQAKYDYTNAMRSFVKALKIRDQADDKVGTAISKNNIGKVFYLQEDIESAITNLNESLSLWTSLKNTEGAANSHRNLADVYLLKKLYGKAKEHYHKAMDLRIEMDDLAGAAEIARFLGNVVRDLGDQEGALTYYGMSLDMNSSLEDLDKISEDYNNISRSLIEMEAYDEAEEANITAFNIREKQKNNIGLAESNMIFGIINTKKGKTSKAKEYLSKSSALLKDLKDNRKTPELYKNISTAYVELGDFKNAHTYQLAYSKSKDILFNKEKSTALLELTTKYESEFETEKQKATIVALEQEQSYASKVKYFLLALCGLGAMLLMVLFNSNKRKKKDNELLTAKNIEIKRQNEEIDNKNEELNVSNEKLDLLNQKLVMEMAERESIEQSSFARDRFLATMSHEMRTPMNIIIGLAHLLLDEEPRPDQVEHLRTLQFSANNLVVFINDVLDFSKIEAGKLSLESRPFQPIQVFEETKERFRLQAKEKSIDLTYRYDSKLPKHLLGDSTRLNQILSNLVSNSLKFTEDGQIFVDVALNGLSKNDATILVTVRDTGAGISKDRLDEMFQNFTRFEDEAFDGYQDSGLGLAITKRLIELQNGRIEAKSEMGIGTEFTVHLPYKLPNETDLQNHNAKKERTYSHLAGNRILLVEDNRINQLVVAKMLRKLGLEVITADNGQEAVDHFSNMYFDLVLMDIQMPIMDGYRATAEIRKMVDSRKRDVPIIALTASAFLTEKEKAKLFGMNDHVGKPFGPDDLLEKISNCLAVYKV